MRSILVFVMILGGVCGCGSVPTTPSAASEPTGSMITFRFDDGWRSTYNNALPMLDANGLKSSNYIITGRFTNPDYIGPAEVLSLQNRGHEVGAHSRSHEDLTLENQFKQRSEIMGSRMDLLGLGVIRVESFSYPFGLYNPIVIQMARDAGFTNALSTDRGYNTAGSDPMLLKCQNLGGSVRMSEVRSWVDTAMSNRTWLIIMIHHVDNTVSDFSITPPFFQEVVRYIVDKKVRVVTTTEGTRLTH